MFDNVKNEYYELWEFFINEHNLTLTDSDLEEIIHQVTMFKAKRDAENI